MIKLLKSLHIFFKNTNEESMDLKEIDDNYKSPIINTSTAIASLKTVHIFLLQVNAAMQKNIQPDPYIVTPYIRTPFYKHLFLLNLHIVLLIN